MNISLEHKVALVTGGSKGIGLAVARAFARSGAAVAIVARGAEALQAARASFEGEGFKVREYNALMRITAYKQSSIGYARPSKNHLQQPVVSPFARAS